jgi:hypothetical protein
LRGENTDIAPVSERGLQQSDGPDHDHH